MYKELTIDTWKDPSKKYIKPLPSFYTDGEKFLKFGMDQLRYYTFANKPVVKTHEIVYETINELVIFKESSVLVLGGGPSTIDFDLTLQNDYDIVMSCNNFFKNPTIKPKFILFSSGTNFRDVRLYNYLTNFSPICCFDNTKTRPSYNYKEKIYKSHPKTICLITRYCSKLGVGVRLICLAVLFGAKKVDFVGIDGYPAKCKKTSKTSHAFDTAKVPPECFQESLYLRQYEHLIQYLKFKIGKNVDFTNFGYGHSYNMLTRIADKKCNPKS